MSSRGNAGRGRHRAPRRSPIDDPVTVERLLAGDPVASPDTRLAELLAAASAPATADELAGEAAVLAAFRAAHPQRIAQPRRRPMFQAVVARLVTAKVAAAAAATAVVLAGGVALAVTGVLPTPGTGPDRDLGAAPGAPTPTVPHLVDEDRHPSPAAGGDTPATPSAPSAPPADPPRQPDAAQVKQLCALLMAGLVEYRTDPEGSWHVGVPALRRLVEMTGIQDPSEVLNMCAELLPDVADQAGRPLQLPPWPEVPPGQGGLVPVPEPGRPINPTHAPGPPGEDRLPPPGIPDR